MSAWGDASKGGNKKEYLDYLSIAMHFYDGVGRTGEKKWAPPSKEKTSA